jgi:Putative Zn-dependent protease, contains TPR repeats
MRRQIAVLLLLFAVSSLSLVAQEETATTSDEPQAAAAEGESASARKVPAETAPAPVATPAATVAAPAASAAAAKLDALVLYRQGRDLETVGKTAEAQAKYVQSIGVCDKEIASSPKRVEAYVVKCWSLFRLNRHAEVISTGQLAMKIGFDARVSEVMGESYYYLGQMDQSLAALQKYIEVAGDDGDRGPTALFFMGEAYLRLKKYSHADIAYSTALSKEPNMPRWWLRLGVACEGEGEYKRAYDSYAKALSLSPGYQEAQDGQARMKAKLGAQ